MKPNSPKQLFCVPKLLPVSKLARAIQRAGEIEPKNHAQINRLRATIPSIKSLPVARLAVVTGRRWPVSGKTFTVSFMDTQDAVLKRKILLNLNAWNSQANVKFVEASDAEVRIARLDGQEGGYWSYLGTDILEIDKDQPTMNFEGFDAVKTPDSEFIRVVRHEAGHTLGFPHEHMRRELVDLLDREKVIKAFMTSQRWSREEVIRQVLTPLEDAQIEGTAFSDGNSIMCYQIEGSLTKNGLPIPGGSDINPADYAFAARIYPKPPADTPSPPPTTGFAVESDPLQPGLELSSINTHRLLSEYFHTTRRLIDFLERTSAIAGTENDVAIGVQAAGDLALLANSAARAVKTNDVSPEEKAKRLRVIYNCVLAALSRVSGTPAGDITLPMILVDAPLEIDSDGERLAVASNISSCLGKIIGSSLVARSAAVRDLVNNVYERIYGEKP